MGITEESSVRDHERRVPLPPEIKMIAPVHAGQPAKGCRSLHREISTLLECGQGSLEQPARAQVGHEGDEVTPIRATTAEEGRILLASGFVPIATQPPYALRRTALADQ